MKNILILGAGMSASTLIRYLLSNAEENDWMVNVVDQNIDLVNRKTGQHPRGKALQFDALNQQIRLQAIQQMDLVISMLPAKFHPEVAKDCITARKHLITPSYVSAEMKSLNEDAKKAGIIIMNEIGVDPGIDHMSAMQIIHKIKSEGGNLQAFRSFCGGLIAPESDDNPWNYKFTWNPRNVVLAGQGGLATFIVKNEYKYIPYHRLFGRLFPIKIEGYGDFEGYANRDSLSYRSTYGIDNIPTIFRGTLRRKDFCTAWNVFVELGMTDNSIPMENAAQLTPRNFINAFLPYRENQSVEDKFKTFLGAERIHLFERFQWLGLFDNDKPIGAENATPAQLLEKILIGKWVLKPEDKDMLVMYHEFEYNLNDKNYKIESSMICIGEDQTHTAMSKTVGLPLGIVSKLILNDEITEMGVMLPLKRNVYEPILNELEQYGVSFTEKKNEFNA